MAFTHNAFTRRAGSHHRIDGKISRAFRFCIWIFAVFLGMAAEGLAAAETSGGESSTKAGVEAGLAEAADADSLSADSLAAFRPDSSDLRTFQDLEAGGANAAAKPLRQDLDGRRATFGLWGGVSFLDMAGKERFSARSTALAAADSGSVVQSQDPVHLAFPLGLAIAIPLTRHLDATLRSQHFWYRQSELIRTATGDTRERTLSAVAHWAGLGIRLLVPSALLDVKGRSGLQLGFQWIWGMGADELYGDEGRVGAGFRPAGIGYEWQLGFQRQYQDRFALSGALGYLQVSENGRDEWKELFPGATGPADWGFSGLQVEIQATWQLGAWGAASEDKGDPPPKQETRPGG